VRRLIRSGRSLVPIERAVLLARFSRQLNVLLVAGDPPGGLRSKILHALSAEHDRVLHDEVLPLLSEAGVMIVRWDQVTAAERSLLRTRFRDVIHPLVTPLIVDSAHPFPRLAGMPLNIGIFVRDHRRAERFACVPLPARLFGFPLLYGGFVRIGAGRLIGVEMVVSALLEGLFQGLQVLDKASFRLIRGDPSVRPNALTPCSTTCLEVEEAMSERMLDFLMTKLNLGTNAVYRARTPLDLADRVAAISRPAPVDPDGSPRPRSRQGPTARIAGNRVRRATATGPRGEFALPATVIGAPAATLERS
jgi:polyphosphate kinase